jgi:uncharacterized membrane protein YphA (DoxX/SURF4 family)
MAAASASRPDWGTVILRIGLGAWLLHHASVLLDDGVGAWLVENTAHRIAEAPDAYTWFGQNVVLRFPLAIAWLIVAGQLAAGCALFVGAFVRPACAGVMFLMLNVFFAGAESRQEFAALVALCALACFVANAGTRLGLDQYLVGRWPVLLTWSRA